MKTLPTDAQILAALKTCAKPHAALIGILIAKTSDVRKASRADVASVLRVARANGYAVDCGDKILTMVGA